FRLANCSHNMNYTRIWPLIREYCWCCHPRILLLLASLSGPGILFLLVLSMSVSMVSSNMMTTCTNMTAIVSSGWLGCAHNSLRLSNTTLGQFLVSSRLTIISRQYQEI